MGVPFKMIVEAQEFDAYAAVVDRASLLVLDPAYQRNYDACMTLAPEDSRGSGPARNFAWDHAAATGTEFHWTVDDNILCFYRLDRNVYGTVLDGTIFRCMEDFVLRYSNLVMVGPNYFMWAPRKNKMGPFTINTRIYSCNLIMTSSPYRWRGRYNEDTDLSIRMLKDGWCTMLFNAFLQHKQVTQRVKGGNTDTIYREGTYRKSALLAALHPDVARVTKDDKRFKRWHHMVDYAPFERNTLVRRPGVVIPSGDDEYGMRQIAVERDRTAPWSKKRVTPEQPTTA